MKRYRSAVTGEYVTEEYAEANPDTTVGETAVEEADRLYQEDVDEESPTADEKWWEDSDDIPSEVLDAARYRFIKRKHLIYEDAMDWKLSPKDHNLSIEDVIEATLDAMIEKEKRMSALDMLAKDAQELKLGY
mgnify:CR=1 FL=1